VTVATGDLRAALEANLSRRICDLRRTPSPYTSTCRLEDVQVVLHDGTRLQLVFKDLSSPGIKPLFVWEPLREIRTYQHILANLPDTATCYASGETWLLLEKVPGVELYQVGDIRVWQAVARWLAELHLWGESLRISDEAHLIQHTRAFYQHWMQRALAHAPHSAQFTSLAQQHRQVVEHLLVLPRTFLHGECYASNVIVDAGATLRVCPVDWEMAGYGPGLMDLAALTAGSWTSAQRDMIVRSYRDVIGPSLSEVDFKRALDACRFQMAVQWLGWSAGWRPPREHANNWLDEALAAAARLGLSCAG